MPKDYNLHLKGAVGDWNFSADMVSYILDKYKDKEVHVLIDSLGGRVNTALSISSLFSIHGNVHCHFVGMCASAATIAPMGCKRITMDADALMLVHKCSNIVFEWDYMNADELAAHIKELEKMLNDQKTIDTCIAGMYAKRCKKSKDDLLDLMAKGAWLTAEQALEWGFIDEITRKPEDAKPTMTKDALNFINSEGIPVPPVDGKSKKGTLLDRLFDLLNKPQQPAPADDEKSPVAQTQPSQTTMDFKNISAKAGVESLECCEGKVMLTEEQAKAVDEALASAENDTEAKDKTIADLQAKLDEANKTIAELKKQPADETKDVVEPGKKDSERVSDDVDANVAWLLAQTL